MKTKNKYITSAKLLIMTEIPLDIILLGKNKHKLQQNNE